MSTPFLTTKFFIPHTRHSLVDRPRLISLLNQGVQGALTLVCAPAGYGKSTLISEWVSKGFSNEIFASRTSLQANHPAICWLALDAADNDLVRYLGYLITAFEQVHPGVGSKAGAMLDAIPVPPPQTILTVLINELQEFSSAIILVLDDYQFISNTAVHESMMFFLDHLPSNVHLVIVTRSDPPIPLARLRARGQLTEIRADGLRFSYEEAICLFNQMMELDLAQEDMARLEERTEGWVAGLQMAALALKSIPRTKNSDISLFIQNFSGSNRYILDYLVEEVLNHQPQHIQDFLLQTSILGTLSGSLCDDVTGVRSWKSEGEIHTSQQILEYLERTNLFLVSLDPERQWYRYHHLFASLLRSRMRQSLEPAHVCELYRRASLWFENQGLLAEAISQALASPNPAYAAEVLKKHSLAFFYQGEIKQVELWLKSLPETILLQHPLLCAVYAASIALLPPYPVKSLPEAEKWMQIAEQALLKDSLGSDLVGGFIYCIRSYWARFRGEPPESVRQIIAQAFSRLPADPAITKDQNHLYIQSALQTILGLILWDLGDEQAARQAFVEAREKSAACGDFLNETASVIQLIQISILQGRLGEAASLCRDALVSFDNRKVYLGHRLPHSAMIGIQQAEILVEQNELTEVDRILIENIELANWTISHDILLRGQLAFARLSAARGDPSAAFEHLDAAEKVSIHGARLAETQRAILWLAGRGNNPEYMDLARQWGQNIALAEFIQGPPQMEWTISLAFARLILAEEESKLMGKAILVSPRLTELLAWLERQKRVVQARGWADWEIQLCVIECLVQRILGEKPCSLATLRHALELAAPGGYIRIFVEGGERIQMLLAELEDDAGWLLPYLHKIQLAFPVVSERITIQPGSIEGLVEPLTTRELDVLKAMAEGFSNHQIADKFILAEGTVKFYVHAVLEKLGVHNRTQAVIEAKKQKII